MRKTILFGFVFLFLVGSFVSAKADSCAGVGERIYSIESKGPINCCDNLSIEFLEGEPYVVGTCVAPISLNCKNLYWIDNENKNCEQKEFCGAYMYYGLQTFETKNECENAGKKNYCTSRPEMCTLEYLPVCGSDEITYGNGCGACAAGVNYWISGECGNKNEDKKYFNLSNGRKAEIKIIPETASERAVERLGELNFTVELKEVGANRTAYEIRGEKQGKMLGLFKIRANLSVEVDAETGEFVKVRKPWWAFLASGI
jgi:hypothetical protein